MFESRQSVQVLVMNTLAFTVCFAVWMMNGALVTFLVEHDVFKWTATEIGWLIGIPVLTGSLVRLPLGVLTDKYGGRIVFFWLMILSAIPTFLLSKADSYQDFLLASLGFGFAGGSFAVGIAYTSVWFGKARQGTALGIFGVGNMGAGVTSVAAPFLLRKLTEGGTYLDGWRTMPKLYALGLVAMALIFWLFTYTRKVDNGPLMGLGERLDPLKHLRVWRFGLYYFLVFGGFVALSQWLIPYYVNVYLLPVTTAGLMASFFSFPGSVVRALGGWMSDHWGARRIMYWVLGGLTVCCLLLVVPRMQVTLPGKGVMAMRSGTVTAITGSEIHVDGTKYSLQSAPETAVNLSQGFLVWPKRVFWHESAVQVGEQIQRRQLLARGVSTIYFQANLWIFTVVVFGMGFAMGIGKAAVYRHIPDYFPNAVGVVGGMVGVLGGLGGFVCPIIFGYMLERTGIWTTCWMLLAALSVVCLVWMHWVIQQMMRKKAPVLMRQMESEYTMTRGEA